MNFRRRFRQQIMASETFRTWDTIWFKFHYGYACEVFFGFSKAMPAYKLAEYDVLDQVNMRIHNLAGSPHVYQIVFNGESDRERMLRTVDEIMIEKWWRKN